MEVCECDRTPHMLKPASAVIFHSNQEILRIDVKMHQKSSARVAFKSFLKVITQTHEQTRDDVELFITKVNSKIIKANPLG